MILGFVANSPYNNCSSFYNLVDALRVIKVGGIYLNYQRITEPERAIIPTQDILNNKITLLRKGTSVMPIGTVCEFAVVLVDV